MCVCVWRSARPLLVVFVRWLQRLLLFVGTSVCIANRPPTILPVTSWKRARICSNAELMCRVTENTAVIRTWHRLVKIKIEISSNLYYFDARANNNRCKITYFEISYCSVTRLLCMRHVYPYRTGCVTAPKISQQTCQVRFAIASQTFVTGDYRSTLTRF